MASDRGLGIRLEVAVAQLGQALAGLAKLAGSPAPVLPEEKDSRELLAHTLEVIATAVTEATERLTAKLTVKPAVEPAEVKAQTPWPGLTPFAEPPGVVWTADEPWRIKPAEPAPAAEPPVKPTPVVKPAKPAGKPKPG